LDRQTYGTGGFNGNNVLKGQDGGGNSQFEFAPGTEGSKLKGGPNTGDSPFEIGGADQLDIGKLMNGAIDPSPNAAGK
jgi:hypothetical protein